MEVLMKIKNLLVSMTVVIIIGSAQILAQTTIMRRTGGDDMFLLPECGALLLEKDGSLNVDMVLPVESRLEEYKALDIQKGDEILMMNGQRVKSAKSLKEMYEAVNIGSEIQFGIRRKQEMFIVSFSKADPEKIPGRQMMVVRSGEPGPETEGSSGPTTHVQTFRLDGSDGNLFPLMGTGLVVHEEEGLVKVHTVMPQASQTFGVLKLEAGDILRSINETSVQNLETVIELWDQIGIGEEVILEIEQEGELSTTRFKKPNVQTQTMIRNE